MNILKSKNRNLESVIKDSETRAAKELDEFCSSLAERYDVLIVPQVILGVNQIKGVVPINSKIEIISNKRLKK